MQAAVPKPPTQETKSSFRAHNLLLLLLHSGADSQRTLTL